MSNIPNVSTSTTVPYDLKENILKTNIREPVEITINSSQNGSSEISIQVSRLTKPRRPLSGYNFFFQYERAKLLGQNPSFPNFQNVNAHKKKRSHRKTHGKIGFAQMAKHIGQAWKKLDDCTQSLFEAEAQKDKARYIKEIQEYNAEIKSRKETVASIVHSMHSLEQNGNTNTETFGSGLSKSTTFVGTSNKSFSNLDSNKKTKILQEPLSLSLEPSLNISCQAHKDYFHNDNIEKTGNSLKCQHLAIVERSLSMCMSTTPSISKSSSACHDTDSRKRVQSSTLNDFSKLPTTVQTDVFVNDWNNGIPSSSFLTHKTQDSVFPAEEIFDFRKSVDDLRKVLGDDMIDYLKNLTSDS